MWNRIFGRKAAPAPLRDVEALTAPLAIPAVKVIADRSPSRSYFGGDPSLPAGTNPPRWNGKPLTFIARLSLQDLQRECPISWLPNDGALLFFYDVDTQPWGFDPKDRGSSAVLHVADLAAPVSVSGLKYPAGGAGLFHRTLRFQRFLSLPSWEREGIQQLKLTNAESDEYIDIVAESFSGMPRHQVGGFPMPVQGDGMELEAQLASNGVYCGDAKGYESPRGKELAAGAADWKLLFQVGSDEDLGAMWGDGGNLYYWVREADAQSGRFENTWLTLQCS